MTLTIPLIFYGFALQLQLNSKLVDFRQHIIHPKMPIHAKSLEPALVAFEILRNLTDCDILDSVSW